MNLELKNKLALVTGSTAGIGFAIAERLLAEGASVIVNGRTKDRVETAIRSLKTKFPESLIQGFDGDISSALIRGDLFRLFPNVDILINNFGVYESTQLSDIHDEDWVKAFELNVVTGASLSQHYLKSMFQKNQGRVVFIASETGVNVPVDMIPYGVSKAAQIALSRGLAETTRGTGVTVNAVLPGPTLSEGVTRYLEDALGVSKGAEDREKLEKDFILKLRPTSLLQRFARAEEVASLVAYLASPLSSATNGAALRVEGGLLRNSGG